MVLTRKYKLEDLLTENQVQYIMKQSLPNYTTTNGQLVDYEIRPAAEGLTGFLGDHMRATLHVSSERRVEKIELFLKRMPFENKPKMDFITGNNYFRREALIFGLIDELGVTEDPKPWCARAYVYTESLLVMPDLHPQGYSVRPQLDTLDLPHALTATEALARFHAATANYETKRSLTGQPWISHEHAQILEEPTFKDSPWLRCAAKLTANFVNVFSKTYRDIIDLESKLVKLYIDGCDSLREYHNTLNVLIHKDLWVNNIMFRYEKGAPSNALLIDFQCIRYGPPVFDLMVFLYYTTSRSFREQSEKIVFQHYYSVFFNNLEEQTKQRLRRLGYDKEEFLRWCEKARMYGALQALTVFPYILMDPITAQKTFDDPETYDKYLVDDRTEPVVAHCHRDSVYKERQLELSEEFVERYVTK